MPRSKTTILNEKKLNTLRKTIDNLLYVISHIQKSNLWLIRAKEYNEVLKISTTWRKGLEDLQKNIKNNSNLPEDEHPTASRKKGIKKRYEEAIE